MDIDIRKLAPELMEDYLHFFDTTPHNTHYADKEEYKCYCVTWSNVNYEDQDFSTAEKRRETAIAYINGDNLQGYLAYCDNTVVGWCNANTRSDCLKCQSGKMYMSDAIFKDENIKVKSVFCFVIAPEMMRNGIAGLLLKRVCEDAAQDGFDFVEAYPNKKFISTSADYMGPVKVYEKLGFTTYYEYDGDDEKLIMRKKLT